MGYNADSNLDLWVPEDKVEAFREELVALAEGPEATVSLYDDVMTATFLVSLINEDNGGDEEIVGDELHIFGWGGGKSYPDDATYDIIAKYAYGTIDWVEDLDPDNRWRIRFKDGKWENYGGVVTTVYPGDKEGN